MFDEIPSRGNIKDVFKLPENAKGYTLLYFFKNWIVGFTCPWLHLDLVQFAEDNPLTYKRVKRDCKSIISRREGFNYLKQTLKKREKN